MNAVWLPLFLLFLKKEFLCDKFRYEKKALKTARGLGMVEATIQHVPTTHYKT